MLDVNLKLSNDFDAHIIKNLWVPYQHDISKFDLSKPNCHGLFGVDDTVSNLSDHSEKNNLWWNKKDILFPYLILVDKCPAGFNLIASKPFLPKEILADFVVYEFFLLHKYRGSKVSQKAAVQGFEKHKGTWEIVTHTNNDIAISFWRKVISNYTENNYSEKEIDHIWGRKISFNFNNS